MASVPSPINDPGDFVARDPFFRIVEEGLSGLADGDNFFELLADGVVFEYVITVPGYPRYVVGRRYRGCLRKPVHLGAHDRRPQGHPMA